MKRLITKFSTVCLAIVVTFVMFSCDRVNEAPPISTNNYPTVTTTISPKTSTITEGKTITYTFKADKPLAHNTPITLYSLSGTASSADYSFTSATFTQFVVDPSIKVPISFKMDNLPEKDEKLTFKTGISPFTNIRLKKSLNPNSKFPEQTITIKNHNDPSGLTVAYQWPNTDDDLDMIVISSTASGVAIAGASLTGDDPETVIISNNSPDGIYFYAINPFSVSESKTDYKFRVGYPDQKVDILPGTFNVASPPANPFMINVGGTPTPFYTLLKVKKTGSSYKVLGSGSSSPSITQLNTNQLQVLSVPASELNK